MTQSERPKTQPEASLFKFSDREGATNIAFYPQAPKAQSGRESQLDYRGVEGSFTFRGEQITQQQSKLGLLISVTLQPDVDAGELSLTLILPPVNLAGEKQQDFTTLAVKARSLGFVVDRSGAQLKYEVLPLKGIAEGAVLTEPDSTHTDVTVTDVSLVLLESNPPQVQIIARGTVPSTGWTNPQLVPVVYIQAPPDCIYEFDFVATPPKEPAAQVITAIAAKGVFPAQGLRGVRVKGVLALLQGDFPDCGAAEK
ncbi:hypothetical protein ACKFKG_25700 [Phormidesmis sp. 146-35]